MPIEVVRATKSSESLAGLAGRKLDEILSRLKSGSVPTLLLLSGGSSIPLLEEVNMENLGPHITLGVLDERFSHDREVNNLAQIEATSFYPKAIASGVRVIDTTVQDGETQNEHAQRFNSSLCGWLDKHPHGYVLATVGMGPDGHISGMMPYPEDPQKFNELFESNDLKVLTAAYDAGDKNPFPLRVTTNMNLMRRIDAAVVFISGKSKRDAWERLNASSGSLAETPARILREMKGEVYVYTDL